MKKLLLLGALILSVNSFSAVNLNIDGGTFSAGTSISGGSTYTVNHSGSITYTTATSYIERGTYFDVQPGATFTITNAAGNQIFSGTGPFGISLYTNLTGAETVLGNAANVTTPIASFIPAYPVVPSPTPTPTPVPTPLPTPSPTPTPGASTSKIYMARSKVALDLAKNITSSGFRSLENAGNGNGTDLDIQYIGGAGNYTDNSQVVKYDSKSNGVSLIGTKSFGNFTLGAGFGYQKSNVKYKERFNGIKEKIDSYQFMLSGKFNFTENVDLSSVLTYSHNSHKYETADRVPIEGVKFNSNIIDFQTRLGSKFGGESGYVKPYVGLGVTRVEEGAIERLGANKAKGTSGNANLGVYGQVALGSAVDLFGNVEYEHRFNRKSYHGDRELAGGSKVEGLDYDGGMKLGLGLKFKLSKFNMTAAYELNDDRNNVFKVGFGAEF